MQGAKDNWSDRQTAERTGTRDEDSNALLARLC